MRSDWSQLETSCETKRNIFRWVKSFFCCCKAEAAQVETVATKVVIMETSDCSNLVAKRDKKIYIENDNDYQLQIL